MFAIDKVNIKRGVGLKTNDEDDDIDGYDDDDLFKDFRV